MKNIVDFINEDVLPAWYVEAIRSQERKLKASINDTKKGKGKFAKFVDAAELIEFLFDFLNDYEDQVIELGKPQIDIDLEEDLIENWLMSDEVVDKEHTDEDFDSDAIVANFKKLGGWVAWYKLATGKDWSNITESKLLDNGRGLDNMFKILDRELSKMNSQKNGADVIGHKLERGDVVALNDYGNNLTLAVVYHVTDKAVYVVYNLKGKELETYVAPNKVVFLYHLKDDLPMSAFVK